MKPRQVYMPDCFLAGHRKKGRRNPFSGRNQTHMRWGQKASPQRRELTSQLPTEWEKFWSLELMVSFFERQKLFSEVYFHTSHVSISWAWPLTEYHTGKAGDSGCRPASRSMKSFSVYQLGPCKSRGSGGWRQTTNVERLEAAHR